MRRAGLVLALSLVAATHVAAGESQRLSSEPPRKYGDAESGFWGSFRPAPSDSQVQAPAAERAPTTNFTTESEQGTASRSNVAQPEAAASEEPVAEVSETPRKRKVSHQSQRKRAVASQPERQPKPKVEKQPAAEIVAEAPDEPAAGRGSSKFFAGAEARWWEQTGNPAVFAFSGCVADYAAASVRSHLDLPHAEYVTHAMAGPCKAQFDAMAGLILQRHGEKGFATVSRELIDTTFIPSVREAIARASADIHTEEQRKAVLGAELQQAKSDMFACFVREAGQRASASGQAPQVIAEAVIETCGPKAERFFAKLDELYPDASADEHKTQQSALRENYLPAILNRVASVRAGARLSAQQ